MISRSIAPAAILAAVFAACAIPAAAAPRALFPDERMGLRCGAAFAMVAAGQARGDAAMKQYPPMAQRGRDYFVRLSAQLMDGAGLDQSAVSAAARTEADGLRRSGGAGPIMPFCLKVLDAQPEFVR